MKKLFALTAYVVTTALPFLNAVSAQTAASASQVTSRTVEDGGTGPYKALMLTETSLATHTVFRPKDVTVFGE